MTTRGVGEAVAVTRAKGRPMLSWVGKRPPREVRAFPAQLVERFTPPGCDRTAAEIGLFDVPERRQDVVDSEQEVTVPDGSTDPVAVRITDMLGEEILILEPRENG
jgi:hypothetical protein